MFYKINIISNQIINTFFIIIIKQSQIKINIIIKIHNNIIIFIIVIKFI